MAFSVCCCVIIDEFARYNKKTKKHKTDVGTLLWVNFFFKKSDLDRNGSFH